MRLSKTMERVLNEQIANEAAAAQIYLAYAAWSQRNGFGGIATFLFKHASEERDHMMKILEYILKRGGEVQFATIAAPGENPSSVHDCFEKIFAHEVENTNAIYKIVKMSLVEEDWATWNLMQWFVKEQVEEETLAVSLLDKQRIAWGAMANRSTLYQLDRDLENVPDAAILAEDVTVVNP